MIYTISVNFRASGINALNCYVVYGHPSPITFWGFAHALTLHLKVKLVDEAVLPVVHYFSNREKNGSFHFQKATSKAASGETVVDIPRADIETTIILKVKTDEPIDKQAIKESVRKMRFGGGVIHQDSIDIGLDNEDEVILNRVKKGSIMTQLKDEFIGDDYMDTFIEKISIQTGKKGWFSPTLLGYALVEEPVQRKNSRFNHPHAFAEPLIGIVEHKVFRKFGSNKTAFTKDSWKLHNNNGLITITN